uniref:Uncharacterized protein n=1 Tax=Amphimedon queenslandica TaxID=400682 RepID=A0A1X7SS05_AMPQE
MNDHYHQLTLHTYNIIADNDNNWNTRMN